MQAITPGTHQVSNASCLTPLLTSLVCTQEAQRTSAIIKWLRARGITTPAQSQAAAAALSTAAPVAAAALGQGAIAALAAAGQHLVDAYIFVQTLVNDHQAQLAARDELLRQAAAQLAMQDTHAAAMQELLLQRSMQINYLEMQLQQAQQALLGAQTAQQYAAPAYDYGQHWSAARPTGLLGVPVA